MMMTAKKLDEYRTTGHVTCAGMFEPGEMDMLIADSEAWTQAFIAELDEDQRNWYLEGQKNGQSRVRKLDDPVFHREKFRALAGSPALVQAVEQLIGKHVSVAFSQLFFKPPEGGGPKPAHQDNYYFGCNNQDGMVTAWVAIDEATTENGCMYFADGTNDGEIFPHTAPQNEPFNLQISSDIMARFQLTPAPVTKGGVSFHHGKTIHQSSQNRSKNWRRAVAIHYVNRATKFVTPALQYDSAKFVSIS